MVLARFQRTIVDDAGNILDGATVTVTDEATGSLANLYSDRNGLTAIGNPIFSDLNGFAAFHVAGGSYRIDAVKASDSVTWRYVGIGTAQEIDATAVTATVQQVNAGFAVAFEVETSAPPSAGRVRFNNADLSAATTAYISVTNLGGSDVQSLLTGLYSASRTRKDRFTLEDVANNTIASFQIDGASAVGSPVTHVALTVSDHTGETSFADDTTLNFQSSLSGADGSDGLFDGTETQVAAAPGDLIPLQDISDSNNPKRTAASTVGAGKQTIWIPAASLKPDSSNGPAAGTVEVASGFIIDTLDFDSSADEICYFGIGLPESFSAATTTLTFQAVWSTSATDADGIVIALALRAIQDGDTFDGSFGTAVHVADDNDSVADQLRITAESSAVTASLTAGAGKYLMGKLYRDVSYAQDDMTEDMQLVGIWLYYTTDANTDD